MQNKLLIHIARLIDKRLAEEIDFQLRQDDIYVGLVKRLKAYRQDNIKVSGLLLRMGAVVSNHYNTEFKLDEIQD